jgi:hypothetical protein
MGLLGEIMLKILEISARLAGLSIPDNCSCQSLFIVSVPGYFVDSAGQRYPSILQIMFHPDVRTNRRD